MKLSPSLTIPAWILIASASIVTAQAAALRTPQNSALRVPGASIALGGFAGATNLVGSNYMLSAVTPASLKGGRVSLVNAPEWVRRYNGGATSFRNAAYNMAAREDGSMVIAGDSYQRGTDYDFALLSYMADGTPLWTNRYDGPAHGTDTARLLAANQRNEVWVAGESMRYSTNSTRTDVVLIHYASNGTPAWTNRYSNLNTNGNGAYPVGLAVDSSGNAYIKHAETFWSTSAGRPVEDAITKFNALGSAVWTKHYPASAPESGQDLHQPGPMALDHTGNLLVAGTTGRDHYTTGTSIVKFAGDGAQLWVNHHPLALMSGIELLSVDQQGNAIVTGKHWSNGIVTYVVMKCSQNGGSLWTNFLAGPAYDGGNVPQLVLDQGGNVFLIGGSPGASPDISQLSLI